MQQEEHYWMINEIKIENFKCFKHLELNGCKKINVILGDNGVGKTALLEAIFFALCSGPNLTVRLRQQRALPNITQGTPDALEQALYGDLFRNFDMDQPTSVQLLGTGEEARQLEISKGLPIETVPLSGQLAEGSLNFVWTNSEGEKFTYRPVVSDKGLQFGGAKETLPNFFFFAAQSPISAEENAQRFSELRKKKQHKQLIEALKTQFPWINDVTLDASGGSTGLSVSVGKDELLVPLGAMSGAVNRIVGVLLAIASRQKSVVLVDEIDNGIFHERHGSIAKMLLDFAERFESQLFISTHSAEWMSAFMEAGRQILDDIAVWRLYRSESGDSEILRFDGAKILSAIENGAEVRGRAI